MDTRYMLRKAKTLLSFLIESVCCRSMQKYGQVHNLGGVNYGVKFVDFF